MSLTWIRIFNAGSSLTFLALASLAAIAVVLCPAAYACSTGAWTGGTSNVPANAMADSPPLVSRFSELCALQVTGTGYVQSDHASDSHYRARFYVLDGLTGSGDVDVLEAYSDEGGSSPLFKISFDGSQFTFDATAAGGGSSTYASTSDWNLVEFDWDSVSGTFDYWVNADARTDLASGTTSSGSGTVEAVRLGAPNGFAPQTGKLVFDAFESHRAEAIGELLVGDATGDEVIDASDVDAIANEILASGLANGQPDCTLDGIIDIFDVVCDVNAILGN